ncbi:MAG: iron-containing alcohol dehydrogenase [Candidatus Margulisbacteria bacterium]|nr:iron-containing alcohol dehydrogenase [Candidatus Margulisiibacteriota bacterium]MBU1021527.1 iron-containing alcohol dehydrogenase [Candidatus Margulisiibacteriota bacterium]MBU1728612.1 iron-containing alcohol dehydrogenase [Candidatus Margulisiibacteriota bacterium]MBU1955809.1 iron-containing alcohol dehydrogenase [Candidatus Margulisiibacteriota bacterium]
MKIKSKIKDYSLEMIDQLLEEKKKIFSNLKYGRLFYFIDENVYEIYKDKVKQFIKDDFCLVVPATELNKSYLNLANYYKALIDAGFTRNDILVTMGGGILQDISGFIASTMYRGISWVFFPTTLLAQADSCIGSKTSINFDDSKNLIGTFYPPDLIYIDVNFCETLTPGYFNSGLGEIIKFHFMSDAKGYDLLKKYLASSDLRKNKYFKPIIWSTLEIKKSYFEGDEFDAGRRNLLNYGHCFGHALESASNFTICHGEAVIVGMGFANLLSLKRKIMARDKYNEFEQILQKYYPRFDLSKISIESLIHFLKRDKKRVGKDLTMILSKDIGMQFKFDDIQEREIIDAYNNFIKKYPMS